MTEPTQATPAALYLRIWRNSTLRTLGFMLLRIIAFIILAMLLGKAMQLALPMESITPGERLALSGADLWLMALRGLVPTVVAYWVLVRFIERRRVHELAAGKALRHSAAGWLVGTAILLVSVAAMAAFGAFSVVGLHPEVYLLGPLMVLGVLPGITEEIIARGILFRVVEEGLGTWVALVISAALFGFGHAANPNATAWSSIAIAIEAGLLLGMAYAWTRSLWFCMGLHAAWNFTQGPLLGIPVSGFEVKGLVESTTQGHWLIGGGGFGAEASILTLIVCVGVAGYFTRRAIDEGRIVRPCWSRARALPAAPPAQAASE